MGFLPRASLRSAVFILMAFGAAPASAQDREDPLAEAIRHERARGSKVLITFHDGTSREATFNHLSENSVTILNAQGRTALPLTNISKIQKIGNYAGRGALLGLIAGFFGGAAWGSTLDGETNWFGPVLGGIGAGAGAIVGRQIDATGSRSHLLYSSARKTTVAIQPAASPRAAGAAISLSWR